MKLIFGAIIATASVIFLGVLIVSPSFFPSEKHADVMLVLNIYDRPNLDNWCRELSIFLAAENVVGTIFISGDVAKKNPSCVTSFSEKFDVGSQTYSFIPLTQISDYSIQLEEIKKGQDSINEIGNLDSKLFKAPHGETDENIYSLLSNNGILADFSYQNQYNKYYDNKFLKFDLLTFNSQDISSSSLRVVESSTIPVQIEFNSSMSLEEIQKIILQIKSSNIDFVTASEITKIELTRRN